MLDGVAVDQQVEHSLSSGDIEEGNPDEDGEQSLAGKKEHDRAGQTEKSPQAVSDDPDQKGDDGMPFVSLFDFLRVDEKVFARGPGDEKGDEQQADQEGDGGEQAHPFEQGSKGDLRELFGHDVHFTAE